MVFTCLQQQSGPDKIQSVILDSYMGSNPDKKIFFCFSVCIYQILSFFLFISKIFHLFIYLFDFVCPI